MNMYMIYVYIYTYIAKYNLLRYILLLVCIFPGLTNWYFGIKKTISVLFPEESIP